MANYKERMSVDELREALEAALASSEEPPPSLEEVALRLKYRSGRALYKRFPELSYVIAERHRRSSPEYKERMSIDELRQALETVLASDEEALPSLQEIARSLSYSSVEHLDNLFPQLLHAIL